MGRIYQKMFEKQNLFSQIHPYATKQPRPPSRMAWIIEFVSKMGLLHHYLFTIDKVNTLQIFGIFRHPRLAIPFTFITFAKDYKNNQTDNPMKKSILLLFAALLPLVASAHEFEVDGIYSALLPLPTVRSRWPSRETHTIVTTMSTPAPSPSPPR